MSSLRTVFQPRGPAFVSACAVISALARPALADVAAPSADDLRGLYQAGKAAADTDQKIEIFHRGVEGARRLLTRNPDDPVGLLWLSAHLTNEALARGKLVALRAIPEIEQTLLHLFAVAPAFEHAAASRALGRLYQKAPPLLSVGSSRKARAWFERALTLAPDFPGNQAFAADFFASDGDDARARALARRCLDTLARADAATLGPEADVREWRAIAQPLAEVDQ